MDRIVAVAANGGLGSGYRPETLEKTVDEFGATFIGCDCGSSDGGPYFLGSGQPKVSRAAYVRDLRPMLRLGNRAAIPVLMGTSGYSGAGPHLDWAVDCVRRAAAAEGISFTMAVIGAELPATVVRDALHDGRIAPLGNAEPLTDATIERASHIVAQMGSEPFEEALAAGADVVVAGRATDPAIYAAVPRMHGLQGGPTWHAAKVLECGAACVEQRTYPDCMVAEIGAEDFVVRPPNESMRCTPQSVAAQTLYENADPFHLIEPGGILDTTECVYEAVDERAVRVSGSQFVAKDQYDVRLEAAELVGFRSIAIGTIADPAVLSELHEYVRQCQASVESKIEQSMGLRAGQEYRLKFRLLGDHPTVDPGRPTPAGPHEVGLLIDVLADTQERADGACAIAWHTTLHHPARHWSGLLSNLALPFSPPHIAVGATYEFTVNHVLRVDDPTELFPMRLERL